MSVPDRGRGSVREMSDLRTQSTREVEGLVFHMTSGLAQLKRLVDALGTTRDTLSHRHRLAEQNTRLQDLAKQIKDKVTALNQDKGGATPQQEQKAKKLLQDFATVLQDYKVTQKVAAEKEASTLPRTPANALPRTTTTTAAAHAQDSGNATEAVQEQQALLKQQRMEEARAMDFAVEYNEALIEERDHGIEEIQRHIGEVNEMFQDLAVLINDQGAQLQTVDQHIVSTAERSRDGHKELVKAERSQRAARNKCLFLWLISALIVSVVLIALFA